MIIDRYLLGEVAKPLAIGSTFLIVVFAGYSSALYLADAAHGLLPIETVGYLILLKTVVALEVLLPTALYLSVIVGLGRLYSDSEMVALSASGVGDMRILKTVLGLSVVIALVVGALSLHARPALYRTAYLLEAKTELQFDTSKLEAGRFYELEASDQVLFAEGIDRQRNRLQQVFFQRRWKDKIQVVSSQEAYMSTEGPASGATMTFANGHAYVLDPRGRRDITLKFGVLTVRLGAPEVEDIGYKRKAEPTARLARSDAPGDIAEFQWRVSAPLAAILLALVGVPLSRQAPRGGRYARLLSAVLFYIVYYNVATLAKTWVDQGLVKSLPGMWWAHALPLALLLVLRFRRFRAFRLSPK